MKLDKKKNLAARTLNVGKNRIIFENSRLGEIKEAITRQDIKDLLKEGAIKIRLEKGRRKVEKRETKRKGGKIKKKVEKRKQEYVKITRKLRGVVGELKRQGKINLEVYKELRKKIKAKAFRSKIHLQEYLKDYLKQQEGEKIK